jgi:hypothetical protein
VTRLFGLLLLLLGAGCSGFSPLTPARLDDLRLADENALFTRCKFRMSVASPWLTGEFDGVALAADRSPSPSARVQVFGDLGPKMLDLVARPDRIVGYFPQTLEGVDCALPGEAAPHLLLFMGVTVLEDLLPFRRSRVMGFREEEGGTWLRLKPLVPGLITDRFLSRAGNWGKRRFSWIYGIGWEETRTGVEEWHIVAPHIDIRLKVIERDHVPPARMEAMELSLPSDVRLSRGSRK